MFGEFLRYTASRATEGVSQALLRNVLWLGAAGLLFLAGAIFLTIMLYSSVTQYFDPATASAILAGIFILAGSILLSIKHLADKKEVTEERKAITAGGPMAAAQHDVKEVVDYFGPMRVVASGFMLGLGLGRRLRR
jgi:hypothetical protein